MTVEHSPNIEDLSLSIIESSFFFLKEMETFVLFSAVTAENCF